MLIVLINMEIWQYDVLTWSDVWLKLIIGGGCDYYTLLFVLCTFSILNTHLIIYYAIQLTFLYLMKPPEWMRLRQTLDVVVFCSLCGINKGQPTRGYHNLSIVSLLRCVNDWLCLLLLKIKLFFFFVVCFLALQLVQH